jgi:dTDP-glucose 4,6-dehydratase
MFKKILVTGADGFIGSHLVESLVNQGYKVKAFVLYNSFNKWGWLDSLDKSVLSEIEVFAGDIRDPYGVKNAMEGCDVVLHLAALIAIPYSYHSPDTYIDTNINLVSENYNVNNSNNASIFKCKSLVIIVHFISWESVLNASNI